MGCVIWLRAVQGRAVKRERLFCFVMFAVVSVVPETAGPTVLHTHALIMRAAPTAVLRPTVSPSATAANAVPHSGSVLYITVLSEADKDFME